MVPVAAASELELQSLGAWNECFPLTGSASSMLNRGIAHIFCAAPFRMTLVHNNRWIDL